MPLVVCAFDPGVSPSMAIYAGPDYAPFLDTDLGVSRTRGDGKKRSDPDVATIMANLDKYGPTVGAVEIVSSRPGEGVASAARFANAAGLLEGIMLGRRMSVKRIAPVTWRKAFKMQPGKEMSRQVCARLFPGSVASFSRVKDHNVADALLMAVLLWCRESGVPVPT
jgi:crossover junction endodeoxyribonuclease RuvC